MSIGKYKAGDTVRVRPDLTSEVYGDWCVTGDMLRYRGRELKIQSVRPTSYFLDIEEWYLGWTDEMLEPVHTYQFKHSVSPEENASLMKNSDSMFDLLME